MKKISAVIITKNEENNIARAIESCLPVCFEILVIDSGSSDKTVEIAKSFSKTKVIETKWQGFSNTKNFGNDLAEGDYILSLDADEALSKELQEEILSLDLEGTYKIPRLTNYCGKWIHHCGWRPDYQTRLFPKNDGRWNQNEVHEKLELKSGEKPKALKADILHYSYYTLSDHIKRIDSYTELGAKDVLKKKKHFLLIRGVWHSEYRFIRTYILKAGFLDGFYGFIISVIAAYVVFIKYAKAAQIQRNQLRK